MSLISQPVHLHVLAYVPTDFFHCFHCEQLFAAAGIGGTVHQEVRSAYPPEMLEEAERLAAWLQDLAEWYGERLTIRVMDSQSLQGFFYSLRHWIRRYPTFVINHKVKYTGWGQRWIICWQRHFPARRGNKSDH